MNKDDWKTPIWIKALLIIAVVLYLLATIVIRSRSPVRDGFPFFRE